MREIKFRGKRLDNGQWIYGDLIQSKPNKVDGKHSSWIIEKTIMPFGAISTPTTKFVQVDPETVGQYTGLKDKNGKEIYKGDIVRYNMIDGEDVCEVFWDAGSVRMRFKERDGWCSYSVHATDVEKRAVIIGNIYEHKHLLEDV